MIISKLRISRGQPFREFQHPAQTLGGGIRVEVTVAESTPRSEALQQVATEFAALSDESPPRATRGGDKGGAPRIDSWRVTVCVAQDLRQQELAEVGCPVCQRART